MNNYGLFHIFIHLQNKTLKIYADETLVGDVMNWLVVVDHIEAREGELCSVFVNFKSLVTVLNLVIHQIMLSRHQMASVTMPSQR